MIYPTDEDPQDKVLVKAFNDRLKEQEHGQNMSDRIASRNRDSTQNDLRFHYSDRRGGHYPSTPSGQRCPMG